MTEAGAKRWRTRALSGRWHCVITRAHGDGTWLAAANGWAIPSDGMLRAEAMARSRGQAVRDLERKLWRLVCLGHVDPQTEFKPQLLTRAERKQIGIDAERERALLLLAGQRHPPSRAP